MNAKAKVNFRFVRFSPITLILLLFFNFSFFVTLAQGDGPRTMLLVPKNIFGVDVKWVNLSQNLVPAGNIYVPGSDIKVNVVPVTVFYTFGIGNRFAQVYANFVPGESKGTVNLEQFGLGKRSFTSSGFADGVIGFKLGLIGAPALDAVQFSKHPNSFSLYSVIRVWYPATYNQDKVMNMGTNRLTLEVDFPMAIPIGGNKKFPFWLEIMPSLEFYSINKKPAPTSAGLTEARQMPLFAVENHLTKNLSSKWWVGLGWRFQYGGATVIDKEFDLGSKVSAFGVGASVGLQPLPWLGFKATYGDLLWGDNGLDARMFRLNLIYTHLNTKKKD